jgi:hypothetical protein
MLWEIRGMMMNRLMIGSGALLMLAACSGEAPKPVVEKPKTLVAGEYEVISEVTMLSSTDKTTPATQLKKGNKQTIRACVAADGTPDPKMFVEAGDKCRVDGSYARSGRLSVQYTCNRAGKGDINLNADGNFTADGYKAIVTAGSSFPGNGDYTLTRMLNAKRLGGCPAGAAAPTAG